jgi:hypothetical protein
MRAVVGFVVVLVACDRPSSVRPSDAAAGDGTAAKNDDGGSQVATTSSDAPAGPPTQESCEATPPKAGCHWTLVPSSYCGGPPPPESMTWPHCSCEACASDAHCGAGERCVLLPTDAECHPATFVCVAPGKTCTPESGCHPDEQCMAIEGRPRCRIPTDYPPRP